HVRAERLGHLRERRAPARRALVVELHLRPRRRRRDQQRSPGRELVLAALPLALHLGHALVAVGNAPEEDVEVLDRALAAAGARAPFAASFSSHPAITSRASGTRGSSASTLVRKVLRFSTAAPQWPSRSSTSPSHRNGDAFSGARLRALANASRASLYFPSTN